MISHALCFGAFAATLVLIYGLVIRPMKARLAELESTRGTILPPEPQRDTIPSSVQPRSQAWTVRIECRVGRDA